MEMEMVDNLGSESRNKIDPQQKPHSTQQRVKLPSNRTVKINKPAIITNIK